MREHAHDERSTRRRRQHRHRRRRSRRRRGQRRRNVGQRWQFGPYERSGMPRWRRRPEPEGEAGEAAAASWNASTAGDGGPLARSSGRGASGRAVSPRGGPEGKAEAQAGAAKAGRGGGGSGGNGGRVARAPAARRPWRNTARSGYTEPRTVSNGNNNDRDHPPDEKRKPPRIGLDEDGFVQNAGRRPRAVINVGVSRSRPSASNSRSRSCRLSPRCDIRVGVTSSAQ